jgi:transglutaminase-like putative cysteine protease
LEYQITHITEYEYFQPIAICHNIAKLIVRNTPTQQTLKTNINISPQPDQISEYVDFFGNKVVYFVIQQEHKKLTVSIQSIIEKTIANPIQATLYADLAWNEVPSLLLDLTPEHIDARQYLAETDFTKVSGEIHAYALQSFTEGRSFFDATKDLMQRIYTDFTFKPGATNITTPLREVMKERKGVCQDFAHLAIACIRSVGLPARYVSGYIETDAPQGKEKLFGVDASHAWFSIYIPNVGWIDFDPTNNIIPSQQHICIGWGRDYADITPLKGVILSSGKHKLSVSVDVRRTRY